MSTLVQNLPVVEFEQISFNWYEPMTGAKLTVTVGYYIQTTAMLKGTDVVTKHYSKPSIDEESLMVSYKGTYIQLSEYQTELVLEEAYDRIIFRDFIQYT
jgi:hypothetical protein